MAVHYMHMMFTARANGLKDLAAKCAITLLKYPDYIPQDKAFYLAGVAAREQGNTNLAFLLLNRYENDLLIICFTYKYLDMWI